jgi:hypothetical protein
MDEMSAGFTLVIFLPLVICALIVFIHVQAYLNDPLRAQKNEEWFEYFEAFMRERYRDPSLKWRYKALDQHFSLFSTYNNSKG